jgi:hypothetical protein
MFGEEVKGGGLGWSLEQAPQKLTSDTMIVAPRETREEHEVEDSAPDALDSVGQLAPEPIDLPESYGETRVVLLGVDPWVLHVYWEVTSGELKKARDKLGEEYGRSKAILRFYDITNIIFDGTNAHGSFDVDVDLREKKWYVHLWSPEKSYFVDLGFKTRDGQFVALVRSNTAETPSGDLAPEAEARYGLVSGDYDLLRAASRPVNEPPPHDASSQTAAQCPTYEKQNGQGGIETGKTLTTLASGATETVSESLSSIERSSEGGEPQSQTQPLGPIDSADAPCRRPAKFSPVRTSREPSLKFDVPFTRSSHCRRRKHSECDLAEMNEASFIAGLSSK